MSSAIFICCYGCIEIKWNDIESCIEKVYLEVEWLYMIDHRNSNLYNESNYYGLYFTLSLWICVKNNLTSNGKQIIVEQ